jgi:putative Holliday junction resolvase
MEEVLLGIDYGSTNTGLAFGRAGLTVPLKVISAKNQKNMIAEISKVALGNKVTKIVMGLPLDSEGKETNQARKIRKFAKLLKIHLKKPVEFVNEAGSSREAIENAIRSGISKKRRKLSDHISAALILRRYYNEREDSEDSEDKAT